MSVLGPHRRREFLSPGGRLGLCQTRTKQERLLCMFNICVSGLQCLVEWHWVKLSLCYQMVWNTSPPEEIFKMRFFMKVILGLANVISICSVVMTTFVSDTACCSQSHSSTSLSEHKNCPF